MIKEAYLLSVSHNSFHSGEVARILGIKLMDVADEKERPCFHVLYPNGDEDHVPMTSLCFPGSYKLVTKPSIPKEISNKNKKGNHASKRIVKAEPERADRNYSQQSVEMGLTGGAGYSSIPIGYR